MRCQNNKKCFNNFNYKILQDNISIMLNLKNGSHIVLIELINKKFLHKEICI